MTPPISNEVSKSKLRFLLSNEIYMIYLSSKPSYDFLADFPTSTEIDGWI